MSARPIPELTMGAWLRFDAIRTCLRIAGPHRVLEIGAGEGGLGAWLAERYEYVGVEPDEAARAVATARLRADEHGDMLDSLATAGPQPFDLVCAFEVLEHIDDDVGALAEWRMRIAADGHLLISVPAHTSRFGPSDEFVGHYRRYEEAPLRRLLSDSGFTVMRWTSYGAGLGQVLESARNFLLRRKPRTGSEEERSAGSGRLYQPKGTVVTLANYAVAAPFRVAQRAFDSTDVGIGYVVLARRSP